MADSSSQQNIIAQLGIEHLPDEQKMAIVEGLSALVQERLLLKILTILPEPDREQLVRLLDAQNQPEIDEFIKQHVPNLEALWEEQMQRVRAESSDMISSTLA